MVAFCRAAKAERYSVPRGQPGAVGCLPDLDLVILLWGYWPWISLALQRLEVLYKPQEEADDTLVVVGVEQHRLARYAVPEARREQRYSSLLTRMRLHLTSSHSGQDLWQTLVTLRISSRIVRARHKVPPLDFVTYIIGSERKVFGR